MGFEDRLTLSIVDDGTLDRVYRCSCRICGRSWEERFSTDDGLPDEDFVREECEEQHAQDSPECYEASDECEYRANLVVGDWLNGNRTDALNRALEDSAVAVSAAAMLLEGKGERGFQEFKERLIQAADEDGGR